MYINYEDKELYLTLKPVEVPANGQVAIGFVNWNGTVEMDDQPITILSFTEENGFVNELSHQAEKVTTPRKVLTERLNSFLRNYRQTEQFGLENTEPGEEDEPIPYDPDQISIRRDSYSIFQVMKMIDDGDLNLSPDFQRNLVWDNVRKSRLVESVLLGIPLPVFYFAENRDGTFNVVDGLQRLSTLHQFMNNGFRLRKLEYLKTDCEDKYAKENINGNISSGQVLGKKYVRRIETAQLVVNVIEAKSPLKVKYDIFKRINEGGRPLNNQEIRNCMASTETRNYLREMAKSKAFTDATGDSVNDIRMDAQELVLRFTAFYLLRNNYIGGYTGDMNNFLDNALDVLNSWKAAEFDILRKTFKRAMVNAYHLFGPYCFRKCLSWHLKPGAPRQLINKSLFTTWSTELSKYESWVVQRNIQLGQFSVILAGELDLLGKYYEVVTTRTTDRKSLEAAFLHTRQLLGANLPVEA